jgi:DUF177 domain-containing protein
MKLRVDPLTTTPTPVHCTASSAWWHAHMPPGAGLPRDLAEPIALDVTACKRGDEIHLEGVVRGGLELECSRCLARYRHSLFEPFRLVLEPAGSRTPTDPEASQALASDGLCLDDDFESGWYRGNELHLDALCLEVISLGLPVKPLCREDCAGLCARCGADLNEAACGCDQIAQDSPFAVLGALRDPRGRS